MHGDSNDDRIDDRRPGGLRGLLHALSAANARAQTCAVAVVVATRGPTYRKPGALALFDHEGLIAGTLSGGCLEQAFVLAARDTIASKRACLHSFESRSDEDRVFGSGSGCGGEMDLMFLPLPPHAPLRSALASLNDPDAEALDLQLAENGAGQALMGTRGWHWNADATRIDDAGVDDMQPPAYRVRVAPPPAALLLGAGPETPALMDFLAHLGWHVEVQEHRGAWSRYARGAEQVHAAAPGEWDALSQRRWHAAIVMTHHFEHDRTHLAALAHARVPFVGLLGPAARRDELLSELPAPARHALAGRLQGPAGPRLGEGPEAIALAIASAMQASLANHRDG